MEKEQLDRIKQTLTKLLALASSPNAHEAALALEKAKEISEKYNIREIDLTEDNKDSFLVDEAFVDSMGSSPWEKNLLMACTLPFDCESVLIVSGKRPGAHSKHWIAHIMGATSDVEMSTKLFKSLRRTIGCMGIIYTKKIPEHYPAKDRKEIVNSYCTGIVHAVHDKIEKFYTKATETTTALVLYKKDRVTEYKESKYPNIRKMNKKAVDRAAFFEGMQDGENVGVHTGVIK